MNYAKFFLIGLLCGSCIAGALYASNKTLIAQEEAFLKRLEQKLAPKSMKHNEDQNYYSRISTLIKKYQNFNKQSIVIGMANLEKINRLIDQK